MAEIDVCSSLCPGHIVVVLRGELDACGAARLARALSVAAGPARRIIVDLAGLTFVDCGSLSALVAARKQAQQGGGDLLLAAPGPLVRRVLSLTLLIHWLPVFASVEEAANGSGKDLENAWLALEPADNGSSPGNGEVIRAGNSASAAGPGHLAPAGVHGERRPP